MSVCLLDVNLLVALLDPLHADHDQAHRWFAVARNRGWATCPITVNGCVRVLSNPAYPNVSAKLPELVALLRQSCNSAHHHFWPDSVSLTDEALFRAHIIGGHQKITDIYLLGLAVHNHGRLATFDRSIPLSAVQGATPAHIVDPRSV